MTTSDSSAGRAIYLRKVELQQSGALLVAVLPGLHRDLAFFESALCASSG
jgi:hypothetical protein